VAETYFGVTQEGNFEGSNILVVAGDEPDRATLERIRVGLMEVRDRRVRPATDTKVIAAWNGLTVAALAEAGALLDEPAWIEAAAEAMHFVLENLVVDGRLMRSYREGRAQHLGFCEDYAFVLEGCLALMQATGSLEWLDKARSIADSALTLFHDSTAGGFFTSGDDAERLITRSKDVVDNAVPSANSVMALQLQRLTLLTGDDTYEERAREVMKWLRDAAQSSPLAFAHLLEAAEHYTDNPREVVIVGHPNDADTSALVDVARSRWTPNQLLVIADEDAVDLPLFRERTKIDGRATAYVCHRGVCHTPVTSTEQLAAQLDAG
jgi:uncharacterized protein YyaL (SSP411 family)